MSDETMEGNPSLKSKDVQVLLSKETVTDDNGCYEVLSISQDHRWKLFHLKDLVIVYSVSHVRIIQMKFVTIILHFDFGVLFPITLFPPLSTLQTIDCIAYFLSCIIHLPLKKLNCFIYKMKLSFLLRDLLLLITNSQAGNISERNTQVISR